MDDQFPFDLARIKEHFNSEQKIFEKTRRELTFEYLDMMKQMAASSDINIYEFMILIGRLQVILEGFLFGPKTLECYIRNKEYNRITEIIDSWIAIFKTIPS
jgi:hypothetical protein